jgi:metal-responsive CopG/Arc/MetJ family transcriptional regulator
LIVNTVVGYITAMVVNPENMTRKLVSLPHTMVQAIDDFRFQERIRTESEAIRRLIELGLATAKGAGGSNARRKGRRPD